MGKLKPKWIKTDIPKNTKIKLWKFMVSNTTYDTWQMDIGNNPKQFSDEEAPYVRMSRDTYKRLKDEISEMPYSFVTSLPSDIQDWIFQLRPELKNVKQNKNNSKEKESYLETDPVSLKAKEEHINEIRNLIEKWENAIPEVQLDIPSDFRGYSAGSLLPIELHKINQQTMFKCLRQHLPFDDLWQSYTIWKTSFSEYIKKSLDLNFSVSKQVHLLPNLISVGEGELHLLAKLGLVVSLKAYGEDISSLSELELTISPDKWITEGVWKILQSEYPDDCAEKYKLLYCQLFNSEEISRLSYLNRIIQDNTEKIHILLDEILIRRDYIRYTCRLCPGQSGSSN